MNNDDDSNGNTQAARHRWHSNIDGEWSEGWLNNKDHVKVDQNKQNV